MRLVNKGLDAGHAPIKGRLSAIDIDGKIKRRANNSTDCYVGNDGVHLRDI